MPYSSHIAEILAAQLNQFLTLDRSQLAAQVSNLDFWVDEAKRCLTALDDILDRVDRLERGRSQHVASHQATRFGSHDPCGTQVPVKLLQRVSPEVWSSRRQSLCDAMVRFLLRCNRDELLSEGIVREKCALLGIEIERGDLVSDS